MSLLPSVRRLGMGLFALGLMTSGALAQAAAPQPTSSQPTSSQLQVARELVEANGEVRAFDGVIPNLIDGAALGFLQTNPDLAKKLRDTALALRPEFEKRKSEIVDILATAYAQRFTEAELKEALAFYSTPVGKKLVSDRAQIVQQAVTSIQQWGAKLNSDAMNRIREEMKKQGYDL
ncbi:hypothetical protein GCM10007301_20330 [Azorhizobium oxalatiphilum]|uniref:DUF2059 domain-containing protein n=1 Tax=Azorhizobium oxalatiphilum TaxID=980631 RepID=A0A917BZ98_9HYPH|nr:DUF2059 domain-containing protein [Azorhizobium oxalatiphilum]GGF60514.1 hypothetical protein GCM10007301_20330 [Azorhizobium oxalatiphilum]